MRIKFAQDKQREFIKRVLEATGCPSLKEMVNRGISVRYSSLKNYYSERRLLPEWLFNDFLNLSGLDRKNFDFDFVDENWGKRKGGRISKKNKNGPTRNRT